MNMYRKKKNEILNFLLIGIGLLCSVLSYSQTRYIDEVFNEDEITIHKDLPYAENISIESIIFQIDSIPQSITLRADVYLPDSNIDFESLRPVVVIHHSELLPQYIIRCFGAKDDLATVELAMALAQRGYVVVCPESRLGWNPLSVSQTEVFQSRVTASIRRAIDNRTVARWLRKTIIEDGNPFNIHPEKFVNTSSNMGGSIGLHTAFYDTPQDFEPNIYTIINDLGVPENVYQEEYFGNLNGTTTGTDDDGNITNLTNYPEYSSEYQMFVIPGPIEVDTSFLNTGSNPPTIIFLAANSSITATEFIFNPADWPGFFTGSAIAKKIHDANLNEEWKGVEFADPIANKRSVYVPDSQVGEIEGMSLVGEDFGADNWQPWAYWDPVLCSQSNINIEFSENGLTGWSIEEGRKVQEQMLRYWLPRACITLDLDCKDFVSNTADLITDNTVQIYPVPNDGTVFFKNLNGRPIRQIEIFDTQSRSIFLKNNIDQNLTKLTLELPNGIFFALIYTDNTRVIKKLIISN